MIEWFGENLWAMWIALCFVLLMFEVFSLDLIFIMLAAGAVAAGAVALAGGAVWAQLLVGGVVALLMLGAIRPVALKHLKRRSPEALTGVDRLTGIEAAAVEKVTQTSGLAEVDGDTWTARASGDFVLEPGAPAVVDSVDGATVYLSPIRAIDWDAEPEQA